MTVAKEPFTGESSKQAVKPLRREGRSVPAALYARVQFCLRKSHARPRVQQAPGLPCALSFQRRANEDANLGRNAPRDRAVIPCIATASTPSFLRTQGPIRRGGCCLAM